MQTIQKVGYAVSSNVAVRGDSSPCTRWVRSNVAGRGDSSPYII